MTLRDPDIKIERNPVAPVFTSDLAGCRLRLVRLVGPATRPADQLSILPTDSRVEEQGRHAEERREGAA